MAQTIDAMRIRIHKLEQKDVVGNAKIINKLKRKIRALEKQQINFHYDASNLDNTAKLIEV